MTTMQRWLSMLALALALAACTQDKPADAAAAPAAASAEAPPPAPAAAPEGTAEIADMTGEIALTEARMARYYVALEKLAAAIKQHPELEDFAMDASETTAQFVARIEAEPRISAALDEAGMSPLEYTRTSEALVSSLFAYGMLEAGAIKELPPEANKDNVAFVKAHKDEIEARMKAGNGEAG